MTTIKQASINAYATQKAQGEMIQIETTLRRLDIKLHQAKTELVRRENAVQTIAVDVLQNTMTRQVFIQVFDPIAGFLTTVHETIESWGELAIALNSSNPSVNRLAFQITRTATSLVSIIPTIGPIFEFMKFPLDIIHESKKVQAEISTAQATIKTIEGRVRALRMQLGQFKTGVLLNKYA